MEEAGAAWAAARNETRNDGLAEVVALEGGRRVPRWMLPIAAAATALLVAVPVVATLQDDGGRQETATQVQDRSGGGRADAAASGIDGGDLGDQSDPATLARAISGALPGAASEAALAAPAPPAGDAATVEPDAAAAPAPVSGRSASQAKTVPLRDRPCTGTVRTLYGQGLGPLVYTALVRWEGAPAVVLAYRLAEAGAPGLDYRVFVMARADCRLLVSQSL